MSKHSRQFKLAVVLTSHRIGTCATASKFSLPLSVVKYWRGVYKHHGDNSFRHREQSYSAEFKLMALRMMEQNKWSLHYTSAYFDLSSPGVFFLWQKRYRAGGYHALISQRKGRTPMKKAPQLQSRKSLNRMSEEELRQELEYLRAENDVLKKFNALAQQKTAQAKKKRS